MTDEALTDEAPAGGRRSFEVGDSVLLSELNPPLLNAPSLEVGDSVTMEELSQLVPTTSLADLGRQETTFDVGQGPEPIAIEEAGIDLGSRFAMGAFFDRLSDRDEAISFLRSLPNVTEAYPRGDNIVVRNTDGKLRFIDPKVGGFKELLADVIADNPVEAIATAISLSPLGVATGSVRGVSSALSPIVREGVREATIMGGTRLAAEGLQGPLTGVTPDPLESLGNVAEDAGVGATFGAGGGAIFGTAPQVFGAGRRALSSSGQSTAVTGGKNFISKNAARARHFLRDFTNDPVFWAKTYDFPAPAFSVRNNKATNPGYKRPDGTVVAPPDGPLDNLVFLRDNTDYLQKTGHMSNHKAGEFLSTELNNLTEELVGLVPDLPPVTVRDVLLSEAAQDLRGLADGTLLTPAQAQYEKVLKFLEDSFLENAGKSMTEGGDTLLARAEMTKALLSPRGKPVKLTREEQLEAIMDLEFNPVDIFGLKGQIQRMPNYASGDDAAAFTNEAWKVAASAVRQGFQKSAQQGGEAGSRVIALEEVFHHLLPTVATIDKVQGPELASGSLITRMIPSPLWSLPRAAAVTAERVARSKQFRAILAEGPAAMAKAVRDNVPQMKATEAAATFLETSKQIVMGGVGVMRVMGGAGGNLAGRQLTIETYRKNIEPFLTSNAFQSSFPRDTEAILEDPDQFLFEYTVRTENVQLARAMEAAIDAGDEGALEGLLSQAALVNPEDFVDSAYLGQINDVINDENEQQMVLRDIRSGLRGDKKKSITLQAKQASQFHDPVSPNTLIPTPKPAPTPELPRVRLNKGTEEKSGKYDY